MDELKKIAEGENFTASSVGALDDFNGKVFLKEALGLTATEVSISCLPSGGEIPFFHTHRKNEETYIIISGEGDFQVDDKVFPISSGSVVKVSPAGKRNMRNTSSSPMLYICTQARENTLEEYTGDDADIVECTKLW